MKLNPTVDSIHINLTPQSTLYETGSIYFDCVRTTTHDDSSTRPNYGHVITYLPLAGTVLFLDIQSSWLWTLSAPHAVRHTRTHSFLLHFKTAQHLLQTCAPINKCNCHTITSFPVVIHFQSTYQRWIDLIVIWLTLIHPRKKEHQCGQDWTRSDHNLIAIEALVWTVLNNMHLVTFSFHRICHQCIRASIRLRMMVLYHC